jgi:hypothetical protein
MFNAALCVIGTHFKHEKYSNGQSFMDRIFGVGKF